MEIETDERVSYFMKEAFKEGEKALLEEEVPVGCVFVYRDEIIGRGYNKVNERRNATLHAEIVSIDQILQKYPRNVFEECELFVTCEPCIMCASALLHLKLKKAYFGCSNERFGGCGSVYNLHQELELNGHGYEVVRGIYEKEAIALLKKFYTLENPNAPKPMDKKGRKVE